jgi:hypothetical protein
MIPSRPNDAMLPIAGEADAWFSPSRFAAMLALAVFAAFPGVLLGWEAFVFRDFGIFAHPVAQYYRDSFWQAELPLWNPLSSCGVPFAAQWTTMVFYPLSLFYLLLPLSWSLGVFGLLHLYWGGLGMYFLARRWTKHELGASVAGLSFAFSGLSLSCLMWPNYLVVLGWMPWVVLLVERAWQEGGRRLVWAVGASSLQMLGGTPELILFTWIIVGVCWLGQTMTGPASPRIKAGRLGLIILLTAGVTAIQLLPFFELFR